MFIPVWLIVVLVIIAGLYVWAHKVSMQNAQHVLNNYRERVSIEGEHMLKAICKEFHRMHYQDMMQKHSFVTKSFNVLNSYRDGKAISGCEWLLQDEQYTNLKESFKEVLEEVERVSGYKIEEINDYSEQYKKWASEYEDKINSKMDDLRYLISEVRAELESKEDY